MDTADKIDELNATLDDAVTQATIQGVTMRYDLEQARRRRNELSRQQTPAKRPRIATIDLSNF